MHVESELQLSRSLCRIGTETAKLFIINIVHGVQDRQEQKQHNRARRQKQTKIMFKKERKKCEKVSQSVMPENRHRVIT